MSNQTMASSSLPNLYINTKPQTPYDELLDDFDQYCLSVRFVSIKHLDDRTKENDQISGKIMRAQQISDRY